MARVVPVEVVGLGLNESHNPASSMSDTHKLLLPPIRKSSHPPLNSGHGDMTIEHKTSTPVIDLRLHPDQEDSPRVSARSDPNSRSGGSDRSDRTERGSWGVTQIMKKVRLSFAPAVLTDGFDDDGEDGERLSRVESGDEFSDTINNMFDMDSVSIKPLSVKQPEPSLETSSKRISPPALPLPNDSHIQNPPLKYVGATLTSKKQRSLAKFGAIARTAARQQNPLAFQRGSIHVKKKYSDVNVDNVNKVFQEEGYKPVSKDEAKLMAQYADTLKSVAQESSRKLSTAHDSSTPGTAESSPLPENKLLVERPAPLARTLSNKTLSAALSSNPYLSATLSGSASASVRMTMAFSGLVKAVQKKEAGTHINPLLDKNRDEGNELALQMNMLEETADPQTSALNFFISANGPVRMRWDVYLVCITLYSAVVVPTNFGFGNHEDFGVHSVFDILIEMSFVLDVCLNFLTSYVQERTEVTKLKLIRRHYMQTWFVPDVLSSVPVSTISYILHKKIPGLGIIKLIRIFKLFSMGNISARVFKQLSLRFPRFNPSMYRLIKTFVVFSLLLHFVACGFWAISRRENFATIWTAREYFEHAPFVEQYFEAVQFSLAVTLGNGPTTTSLIENIYMTICYLLAIMVNAFIIGSVSMMVSKLDSLAVAQKEQIDGINEYLRYRQVPKKLHNTITDYYEYLWESKLLGQKSKLLKELPDKLKLQLNVALKRKLLKDVPLFKACTPMGVIAVIQNLTTHICTPGELIVRQHEKANCMFLIGHGSVRVFITQEGEDTYIVTLHSGSHFGEIALTSENATRTASVRCETFCELHVLSRHDFLALLEATPTLKLAVELLARNRVNLTNAFRSKRKFQSGMASKGGGMAFGSPGHGGAPVNAILKARSKFIGKLSRASSAAVSPGQSPWASGKGSPQHASDGDSDGSRKDRGVSAADLCSKLLDLDLSNAGVEGLAQGTGFEQEDLVNSTENGIG